MEILSTVSGEHVCGPEMLQVHSQSSFGSANQIRRMKDYALDEPESREKVIELLQTHAEKYRGTRGARIAARAIATILAAGMLEILQGDA